MSDEKPKVTIQAEGTAGSAGTVEGSGTLTVDVSDASKAALKVDYSTQDKVTVSLSSEVGFNVQAHNLTLSAEGDYQPLTGEWKGNAALTFEVSKHVSMQLGQAVSSAGGTTSLGITIQLGH